MSRRGTAIALAAAGFGIAGTVSMAVLARLTVATMPESSEVLLLRDRDAWHGGERRSSLVRWINLETVGPLVVPAQEGAVPRWAEPGPADGARHVRAAAVAVGWPFPAFAARWRADRADQGFPAPAERETSGEAPKEAVRRLFGEDRHAERSVLWPGAALDAAAFALPCWAALRMLDRRRATVTRPG